MMRPHGYNSGIGTNAPLPVATARGPAEFRGYAVRREIWTLAGHRFDLTWPADIDRLLDLPSTHERFNRDEYMPYWAQPWPASALLAEAVLADEPGRGRPAVEIGCGIGLAGLAAAHRGWSVTIGDYDADAVAFAELNAARSGLSVACRCMDYREPLPSPQYDLVLGADLLYERKKCEPVARWVASALKPGGVGLLSDPNRSAADSFPDYARAAGLRCEVTPWETSAPAGLLTRGRIWRVTR